MKKVLFTATVDSHILQFHLPYLKWFKEQGYEVHVATNGDETIQYCDIKHNISFERSPFKINNLKAIKQLKKIIDNEKFNIIHCHTPMGSVVTRLAAKEARKHGTKVIYTAHGFHFYKGAPLINWIVFYPIEKWLSRYTDCLITINEEDYNLAKRKFKAKQIELVHGVGVDEDKFNFEMSKEDKHELRKSIGLKDDDFVLIQVGELNKNKNQMMAINAMKDIVEKNKNIHLLIVGKGKLENLYREKIKKYELEENIHILGYRNDIPKLMKISDVLLSLSHREGLPVNVIEGMFCKLPVIATNCRGNRDLVKDELNGYIITLNKIDELKNKILLIRNNYLKRENNMEDYCRNTIMQKIEKIYITIEKKTVLHLLASNKYSGAENIVCQIMKSMQDEFDMIYCSPRGTIEARLKKENIKYIPIKQLNIHEAKRIIRKVQPDIIHAHDFKASMITAFIRGSYTKISHIHQTPAWVKKINIKSILYYLSTFFYSKIIMVSNGMKENYIFYNKIESKTIVLNNYINEKEVLEKASADEISDIDLIFVGRLEDVKNPVKFIEIIYEIKKKKNNIKAALIGDGSLFNECLTIIKEKNLSENIEMLGYKENPFPYMLKSKFIISTSKNEAFGLSTVEGILLGNVVISTNTVGIQEILGSDYYGICNNIYEFEEKIIHLMDNKKEYEEILKYSKEKIEKYVKKDLIKNELMEIYEKSI